jgi:hypothetical protein
MRATTNSHCNLITSALLVFFSFIAISINFFYYKYPGINYFPPHVIIIGFSLLLMWFGSILQFGKNHKISQTLKELIYFFLVMSVIALCTIAAQFTPFAPIDQSIVNLEESLGIKMESILEWSSDHPSIRNLLGFIYDTLPMQMSYIPLAIIISQRFQRIKEYYFLLIFSALLGFSFFYFFPTLGPASIINSPYFSVAQRAEGLKFQQIHHHIPPTTMDGGMVALPSFHTIWGLYCVYIIRDWPIAVAILLPINFLLILSCVLLGWHYPIDIIASIVIVLLSHFAYRFCRRNLI